MSAPGYLRRAEKTKSNWRTPNDFFQKLDAIWGFTLDGAADHVNALVPQNFLCECCRPAQTYDALPGERIFVNPPYGRTLHRWTDIFVGWKFQGATVVALLPNSTDTQWFYDLAQEATQVLLLKPRISFLDEDNIPVRGNSSGSSLFVLAPNVKMNPVQILLVDWKA